MDGLYIGMYIGGVWRRLAKGGATAAIVDPATEEDQGRAAIHGVARGY